jgi:hypothetical protein
MNLEDMLSKKMTKTASSNRNTKTASAVADALESVTQLSEKTASAANPAGVTAPMFDKLAAELAAQDMESSLKTAQLYGAAIADGFMSQLGMYEKVAESLAEQQSEKIAKEALFDPELVALVKEAQINPRAFLARVQREAEYEDSLLKEAEEQEAAELEQLIQIKAAEHYAHGYEIGQLLVSDE